MKKITTLILVLTLFFTLTGCKKNNIQTNYKFELFTDGIGFAMNSEKKYGYINENFEVIIDFIYDDASAFNDGVALVELDEEFFLINTKGEKITESFDYMFYNEEIKRYFASYNTEDPYDYMFDEHGKFICKYDEIHGFRSGEVISVQTSYDNCGYIDVDGNVLLSDCLSVESFYGEYSSICDSDNNVWVIDKKMNKIHNFGQSRMRMYGKYVVINDSEVYDIYGNKLDKEVYVPSSGTFAMRENYYYYGNSYSKTFCSLINDTKIEKVEDYEELGEYLIIFKDQTLYLYNDKLEVLDTINIKEEFTSYSTETDYYRNNLYMKFINSDSDEYINYMFNYQKGKIEIVKFLDEYDDIAGIYKDYICVVKETDDDYLYGLIKLNGKVVFRPKAEVQYIATDDGYIVNNDDCTVYNKNKKVIYQNKDWYSICFNFPGY